MGTRVALRVPKEKAFPPVSKCRLRKSTLAGVGVFREIQRILTSTRRTWEYPEAIVTNTSILYVLST
jgi:hypothetical protein